LHPSNPTAARIAHRTDPEIHITDEETMKKLIILTVLLIGTLAAAANRRPPLQEQTDANIFGHVVDAKTGEHLPFITLTLRGTVIGTTTDATGHYFLKNLPVGKHVIEAHSVGYDTVRREVVLRRGVSLEINLELSEQALSVGEVVVRADRGETIRKESPSLIHVLDSRLFETANAVCLADGLSFQPGVRVEDGCQNCGFAQVRINGLDGHYAQILLDSRPLFSALNGVYGLEQIPAGMIERVEIIRGGGSALVGASAIGGTVNIITKEPLRNQAEIGHSILSVGCGGAYDNNSTLNASLVADNHKAGIYIYGQSRHRSGYDRDGDAFTELPYLRGQTIGMRSFIRTGERTKLTLEYHGINEFRRGGDRLDLPAHEAQITEQVDHDIQGGGADFTWTSADRRHRLGAYAAAQATSRKSYYGGTSDRSDESLENAAKAYGKTNGITAVGGADYRCDFRRLFFMPATLTFGIEYNFDRIDDTTIGYGLHTDQRVRIFSGMLQNEWKNERWSLLIGGRIDKHNLIDHAIFSPRVNLRYNPAPQIDLRLSYAGGFRAPQTFDEDLHIALVGGERVVTRLAEGLHEEHSRSVSLSADLYHTFGRIATNLLVEGFFTDLDDVFATRYLPDPGPDGETVLERYNGTGATVAGLNVEARADFPKVGQIEAGITLQRSRYKEALVWSDDAPAERKLFRTPDLYGYFTATFTPFKRTTAALSGTYTGRMLVQHAAGSGVETDTAVRTRDFLTVNLKIAYDIPLMRNIALQLNGGLQNLFDAYQRDFDQGWNRDSGYVYGPSLPRSWFLGAKLRF